MKYFLALFILLFGFIPSYLYGIEVPHLLRDVKVDVAISLDTNRVYTYAYTVSNNIRSQAPISLFSIDIKRPSLGIQTCSEELADGPFMQPKKLLKRSINRFGLDIIPLGGSSPDRWPGAVSPSNWIDWLGSARGANGVIDNRGRPNDIYPGSLLSGFKIKSFGLPGIRDYIVQPYVGTGRVMHREGQVFTLTSELKD